MGHLSLFFAHLKDVVPGLGDDLEASVGAQLRQHQASSLLHSRQSVFWSRYFFLFRKAPVPIYFWRKKWLESINETSFLNPGQRIRPKLLVVAPALAFITT